MMKKKKFIFLFLGITLIILGIILIRNMGNHIIINKERINIEIADTDKERQEGLMFRENLQENHGMLFVYEKERIPSFWMKNTKIPLDIIFINSDSRVVDLFHAQPCKKEPCETYTSENKSLYVLETNINKFDESIIGTKVEIEY